MKTISKTLEPKGLLMQIRLRSKTGKDLSPYEAYEELQRALASSDLMAISQVEFRVKDDEKTSI